VRGEGLGVRGEADNAPASPHLSPLTLTGGLNAFLRSNRYNPETDSKPHMQDYELDIDAGKHDAARRHPAAARLRTKP